jgi:hypothetical protein
LIDKVLLFAAILPPCCVLGSANWESRFLFHPKH